MADKPQSTEPSELILAAQEQLMALRQANEADRKRRGLPPRKKAALNTIQAPKKSLEHILADLPDHMGWGSLSAAQKRKLLHSRVLSCSHSNVVENPKEFSHAPESSQTTLFFNKGEPNEPILSEKLEEPENAPSVSIFAHVLDAIHRHKSDGVGRIWLLLRHLDKEKGEGRVKLKDARYQICDPAGRLKCLSKKRFQQLIRAGEGRFWHKSKNGRFVHYHSEARVADALGLSNIYGLAIEVPISDLLQSIRRVRALFYEAFHCGRGEGYSNPITRQVMQNRGMADGRTQREYEALRGVLKRSEFAIISKYSKAAWQRAQFEDQDERVGGPAFIYIDYKGVLGKNPDRFKRPKGKRHWHNIYIMRQIGNAYAGNLKSVKRGRRWTSHKLRHLCHSMPTFTGSAELADYPVVDEPPFAEKIYYGDAKEAQKSLQRQLKQGGGECSGWPRYNPGSINLEWKEEGKSGTEISRTSFYWEEHFFMA